MRRRIRSAALPLHRYSLPQLAVDGALVALGTPVVTVFEGRLGAVDERLIAEGRMRRLEHAEDLDLHARARDGGAGGGARVRRDPELLVELLLSPLRSRARRRPLRAPS